MVEIKSNYKAEELEARWDEMTSPARFAGCDDTLDLIFVAARKDRKVRLVRKARIAREPFCCVFRGKISANGSGSSIKGVFTKAIADYIIVLIITALLFYVRHEVILRGSAPYTVNVLLAVWIVAAILLLYNTKRIRRKYIEFLERIAGGGQAE